MPFQLPFSSFLLLVVFSFLQGPNILVVVAETFEVTVQAIMDASVQEVFCLMGNPENDPLWRNEVVSTTAVDDGPWAVETRYTEENGNLLLPDNFIIDLELITLESPTQMVLETLPGDLLVRADRSFEKVDDRTTRIHYNLIVDTGLVEEILGLPLPTLLVKCYYAANIRFNLCLANRLLRTSTNSFCE